MQRIAIPATRVSLFALTISLSFATATFAADSDGDGVDDTIDNCLERPNATQDDGDGDGCGDLCDADFDQSGRAGASDLADFASRWASTPSDPEWDDMYDFNKDGLINGPDHVLFRGAFFAGVPGPSLVAGRDPVACP